MSLRSRRIAVAPRVRRRSRGITSGTLLTAGVSVVHILSSSVVRRHVTTRVSPVRDENEYECFSPRNVIKTRNTSMMIAYGLSPVDIWYVWRIMRSGRVRLIELSLLRHRVSLWPYVLFLRIVLIGARVLVSALLYPFKNKIVIKFLTKFIDKITINVFDKFYSIYNITIEI